MLNEINNFTLKPITEFTKNDTLYIQKNVGGFSYTFLVEFTKFEKGMVTGIILDIQPNNTKQIWINNVSYKKGVPISSRISKCYTYQKGFGCCWFVKDSVGWVCC
jgi:hypothetical protein